MTEPVRPGDLWELAAQMAEDIEANLFPDDIVRAQVKSWCARLNVLGGRLAGEPVDPNDADESVVELARLLAMTYRPEGIAIWLLGAKRQFGGRSPVELWEAGERERVLAAAQRLVDGTPS